MNAAVPDDFNDNSADDTVQDDKEDEAAKPSSPAKTPGRSPRSSSGGTPTKTTPTRGSKVLSTSPALKTPSPAKSPVIENSPSPIPEPEPELATEASADEVKQPLEPEMTSTIEPEDEPVETPVAAVTTDAPEIAEESVEQPEITEEKIEITEPENESKSIDETIIEEKSNETNKSIDDIPAEIPEEKDSMEDEFTDVDDNIDEQLQDDEMEINQVAADDSEPMKETITEEMPLDDKEIEEDEEEVDKEQEKKEVEVKAESGQELKHEPEVSEQANEVDDVEMKPLIKSEDTEKESKDQDRRDRKERKRKRSTSSQDERHKSPPPTKMDDEPEIDYSRVLLSWYDSDLNLVIDKTKFVSATPMHNDGFGYVWAGARASFGFNGGKVYYEVKITHQCNVTLQDEEYPHVLRAGWSVALTSMQLGEDKLSYGYGGTGKISTGNNFKDYGPSFGLNDILGCYLDMEGEEIIISYTLNGDNLGEAFKVKKDELEGKPLFPHILTKNCAFVCNFGDEDAWNEKILEGYVAAGLVDIKERIPGPQRPDKREDCEMVMMCGLPGSGKTVWANKYAAEHPEKMYNILGTNTLIDKMKVNNYN